MNNSGIIKIVKNSAYDSLRKNCEQLTIDLVGIESITDKQTLFEDQLILTLDCNMLISMLEDFNRNYATIIKMRYLDELSIKEISSALNISTTNVTIQIIRALCMLRDKLKICLE